jgi:PIN domain nuclease of toxin-antitoxin system
MNFYVSDTHALFWYLTNSPALGVNARLAFDEADTGQALIYLSAIVIAELYYLNEKKGRPRDFASKYARRPTANSLSCCHSTHFTRSTSTHVVR